MGSLSIGPLIQLGYSSCRLPSNRTRKPIAIRADGSPTSKDQQDQLNVSVLRFTFGIPGLDETYLPRWIGYGFGSLLLLNHFAGSDSSTTSAQLRTEGLGLSLAAFSVALPYFGRFLKGATRVDQVALPEGTQQIFVMSPTISDSEKEEFAWGSYVLLRNTNTVAVLISIQGELCVRGYWNVPYDNGTAKAPILDWFQRQIENIGLGDLKDVLYFPQVPGSELWEMLPNGTRSLLVVPVLQSRDGSGIEMIKNRGFVILASNMEYAYTEKDRAWIRAIANKFRVQLTVCPRLERFFGQFGPHLLMGGPALASAADSPISTLL
ncbi:unnamed protein product [Linum tenue]|uniref:Protein COFACTOR ASSEMBLY OF COMPLEX C SUBUNIT B CCB2, chloroplastic n=1 Tax=Linum tenue TaxID=586396 RepID=A0AAV0QP34_9ROSI|nr:unnamed protein product [Linum tenue]